MQTECLALPDIPALLFGPLCASSPCLLHCCTTAAELLRKRRDYAYAQANKDNPQFAQAEQTPPLNTCMWLLDSTII